MKWRIPALIFMLVFGLSCLSAQSSSAGVVLSPDDISQITQALQASQAALKASSQEIQRQSTEIKLLWIGFGVSLIATTVEAIDILMKK